MTKNEMLCTMYIMADELVNDYSYDRYRTLEKMACDWNSDHDGDDEIFMSELRKEDGDNEDGFVIEDNIWYLR